MHRIRYLKLGVPYMSLRTRRIVPKIKRHNYVAAYVFRNLGLCKPGMVATMGQLGVVIDVQVDGQ